MPDIDLRIQVDGVNELMQGFQRVTTAVGPAMDNLEDRVLKRLKEYPPEAPGGTYTRTGMLGESWHVEADMRGTNLFQDRVSLVMRNDVVSMYDVHYAGYVQDEEMQAAVHQGRWETAQQILRDETEPFLDDLAGQIEQGFTEGAND